MVGLLVRSILPEPRCDGYCKNSAGFLVFHSAGIIEWYKKKEILRSAYSFVAFSCRALQQLTSTTESHSEETAVSRENPPLLAEHGFCSSRVKIEGRLICWANLTIELEAQISPEPFICWMTVFKPLQPRSQTKQLTNFRCLHLMVVIIVFRILIKRT